MFALRKENTKLAQKIEFSNFIFDLFSYQTDFQDYKLIKPMKHYLQFQDILPLKSSYPNLRTILNVSSAFQMPIDGCDTPLNMVVFTIV